MYYDMDYFGVLMSKIGGGFGLNNYGYGSIMKTSGRQTLTRGQSVKQASYADTFMKMSKAERRSAIESNINTGSSSGKSNAKKSGTVGRSNLYNSMYGAQQTNGNVLSGAVKAEAAAKTLTNDYLYDERNSEELYKTARNLVEGYNDIVSDGKVSSSSVIQSRANALTGIARQSTIELNKIGISYDGKTGKLMIDEKKFKAADKNNIKSALGSGGSFGQKVGSSTGSIETAAANAVRYGTGSALGKAGYFGNSGLYGLMGNNYGLAGGYGSSFGLSSYLNNWFG